MIVTGPCELLVMYNRHYTSLIVWLVTGPCELLVMYNNKIRFVIRKGLQDPVNF